MLESLLLELETGARCGQSTGSTTAPLRADTTTAATTTTTTTTTDSNYIPHSYHDQDEEHEDVSDYEDDEHLVTGCEHVDRTGIVRVGATKLNGGEAIRHYQPGKGLCRAIIVKTDGSFAEPILSLSSVILRRPRLPHEAVCGGQQRGGGLDGRTPPAHGHVTSVTRCMTPDT